MKIEEIKDTIVVELKNSVLRIRESSRMKKEFNRTFFKERELLEVNAQKIKEMFNIKEGFNSLSKNNLLEAIKKEKEC